MSQRSHSTICRVFLTSCAVAVLYGVSACGHAPPRSTPAWQPAATEAPVGTLTWEVADRFRLLVPRSDADATQDLFDRFKVLYDREGYALEAWRSPPTSWVEDRAEYQPGYVAASSWTVILDAHVPGQCTWTFHSTNAFPGSERRETYQGPCRGFSHLVGGSVRVEVSAAGSQSAATATTVAPRDVLIASLGDSYASGEGVPTLARHWFRGARWMDKRCHRSLFSGPGLAALEYARLNKHVSVTHVSFACSGATLNHAIQDGYADGGILLPYSGVVDKSKPPLEPQVDALRKALTLADGTVRNADYLTLSIGGNDFGFGDAVRTATTGDLKEVKEVVQRWSSDAKARFSAAWLAHLRMALDAAHASRKWGTVTVVASYPNPTSVMQSQGDDENENKVKDQDLVEVCGGPTDDLKLAPPFTMAKEKANFLRDELAVRLNEHVAMMRTALDAVAPFPDEVSDYNKHGYCAGALSLSFVRKRWINTVADSLKLQGTMPYFLGVLVGGEGKTGAMHPNIRGQAAFAVVLLRHILENECDPRRNLITADDPDRPFLCGKDQAWKYAVPGGGVEQ